MITKGVWSGKYEFDEKTMMLVKGLGRTRFTIEITETSESYFTGIVQDDLPSGGTPGIGKIEGKVFTSKMRFVKRMPAMSLIIDRNGTRKVFNKPHRPIYYSGTFSADRKTVTGEWHFKGGLIWIGLIPRIVFRSGGTWTMSINY